jgi:hypothetical protein
MIAALILVVSLAALLQFFVSYCRSLIAACSGETLSSEAREVTGIADQPVRGDEFPRLLQLVRLCPESGRDRNDLRAVGAYFLMLSWLRNLVEHLLPAVALWAEAERQACSYFAAVALDRRISRSRGLMAEQLSNRL